MATVECLCPPTAAGEVRHPDGDTVTLWEKLDFRSLATLRYAFVMLKQQNPNANAAETLALLNETYVTHGVESWTLEDAKGRPVDVTPDAVRETILSNYLAATVVGDEADGLYSEVVIREVIAPLVETASQSSRPTPINASTSARKSSPTRHPKQSRPSSISTIQTDDTETTSSPPDTDSKSSQKSA